MHTKNIKQCKCIFYKDKGNRNLKGVFYYKLSKNKKINIDFLNMNI